MKLDGMPIDLPVATLKGRPFTPDVQHELVISRAYRASVDHLRRLWTEPQLRDRWVDLRREASLTLTRMTLACVQAMIVEGGYVVHLEACFQEDEGLAHLKVRFSPVKPVNTNLLITSGFVDLWEERLYRIADLLADQEACP